MTGVAPSSARRPGSLSAFRQPFVTDRIFWIAALLSLVIGVLVGGALYALSEPGRRVRERATGRP